LLLRKCTGLILVLIEATGSVDRQKRWLVEGVFEVKFRVSTVTSVEHRLRTLSRCYKVIMLDTGKIVKMEIPEELRAVDGS
jgi:ABC-type multidrug transport system fused ATPase/permease subunit